MRIAMVDDDEPMIRRRLRKSSVITDLKKIIEAGSGDEAIALANIDRPGPIFKMVLGFGFAAVFCGCNDVTVQVNELCLRFDSADNIGKIVPRIS